MLTSGEGAFAGGPALAKPKAKTQIIGVGNIDIELNVREIISFHQIKNPFEIKDAIHKEVQNCKLKSNTDYRLNL